MAHYAFSVKLEDSHKVCYFRYSNYDEPNDTYTPESMRKNLQGSLYGFGVAQADDYQKIVKAVLKYRDLLDVELEKFKVVRDDIGHTGALAGTQECRMILAKALVEVQSSLDEQEKVIEAVTRVYEYLNMNDHPIDFNLKIIEKTTDPK